MAMCWMRRSISKGDVCVADVEELKILDAAEVYGVFLGITFIVITRVKLFLYRRKSHSQFHSSILMLSGGHVRHWIFWWKVASTTIGKLMVASFRVHGPVSPCSQKERKTSRWIHVIENELKTLIEEAHESTRKRIEKTQPNYDKDKEK